MDPNDKSTEPDSISTTAAAELSKKPLADALEVQARATICQDAAVTPQGSSGGSGGCDKGDKSI